MQVPAHETISVVSATYNSKDLLPRLIASLRAQTNKNFEWVVADGASTDGTLDLLEAVDDLNIVIISQKDFGIYDALNRAIQHCAGKYYLVLGSDDIIYPHAISEFLQGIEHGNPDIVTAHVKKGDTILKPRGGSRILNKHCTHISAHSVGTVFKKSLHDTYGYYSTEFPIAADLEFMLKALSGGADVKQLETVAGEFAPTGVSSTNVLGAMTEDLRILMKYENKALLLVVFVLKFIKNFRKF